MSPPGTAYMISFCSANRETIRERMGLHVNLPSLSLETRPGLTSISWPTVSTPRRILPPATPPFRSSTSHPGLFTSNERMMISRGSDVKSLIGMGILLTTYSAITSMLYLSWADMGMTGAPSATVPARKGLSLIFFQWHCVWLIPWTNFSIWSYCSLAWLSFTKSILFCKIRMCLSFMISMAAKCSDVWGWGQDSFPAARIEVLVVSKRSQPL